jgi:hypothetical protein
MCAGAHSLSIHWTRAAGLVLSRVGSWTTAGLQAIAGAGAGVNGDGACTTTGSGGVPPLCQWGQWWYRFDFAEGASNAGPAAIFSLMSRRQPMPRADN